MARGAKVWHQRVDKVQVHSEAAHFEPHAEIGLDTADFSVNPGDLREPQPQAPAARRAAGRNLGAQGTVMSSGAKPSAVTVSLSVEARPGTDHT